MPDSTLQVSDLETQETMINDMLNRIKILFINILIKT